MHSNPPGLLIAPLSRLSGIVLIHATPMRLAGGTSPLRTLALTSNPRALSCSRRAYSSAASSSRWKSRQGQDLFAREAKVKGLKSRAAFKLLEMDAKYHIFKPGQTVIDLGFAPGSWSQVAFDRTKPAGQVIGIDILPAQPPRGVSAIHGNFLSPSVQSILKDFIRDSWHRQKVRKQQGRTRSVAVDEAASTDEEIRAEETTGYIDQEKKEMLDVEAEEDRDRPLVDVVLSDMSEPWPPQTTDSRKNGLSNTYHRMMNTSGMAFRDHAGSMDLCSAALKFAGDTLRNRGHFICKFYQGAEDKQFEARLKRMFAKVYREKPESSRKESKEAYFVALRRKKDVTDEPR